MYRPARKEAKEDREIFGNITNFTTKMVKLSSKECFIHKAKKKMLYSLAKNALFIKRKQ